jgi:hypothetical protein
MADYSSILDTANPPGDLFTRAEENKTEEEAAMFRGITGIALDQCHHSACDNVTNLDSEASELHAKATADSVAAYASL